MSYRSKKKVKGKLEFQQSLLLTFASWLFKLSIRGFMVCLHKLNCRNANSTWLKSFFAGVETAQSVARFCEVLSGNNRVEFKGPDGMSQPALRFACLLVSLTLKGSIFLALNFCSSTDYQKLWHNCSLFVKTSFDPN